MHRSTTQALFRALLLSVATASLRPGLGPFSQTKL
jgi:hypothetical protein